MTAPDEADDRLTPDLLKLALVVIVGTFVVQMDGTMVNVALNTLRESFDTTVPTIQWISTGYLLALAMAIPPAGWAVDRFGAKRTWTTGLVLFLVGSALCGSAWSAGSMIVFRVIQGLGGGILLPLSQAILARAAGPKRLGRLMAVVGVPFLLGPVVGPIVGGVLVDELHWRWIFFINVPVLITGLLLSGQLMPADRPAGAARLDVLGLVLLSPALAGIVYGLSEAGNKGGFGVAAAYVPLLLAAALLIAFVVHALRARVEPIIDLRLLRSRNFAASSAMLFFVIIAMLGAMLLVPLYYQMVRGQDALHAGLLLAPQGAGAAAAIAVCGKLADRYSHRPIALVGVLLTAAGLGLFTRVGPHTSGAVLSPALVLIGAGFGAVMVSATAAAYRGLPSAAIPRATSSLRIFQQIGGSLGVALLAIALQGRLHEGVRSFAYGWGRVDVTVAQAFAGTFRVALMFTVLALVPVLLLRRGSVRSHAPAGGAGPGGTGRIPRGERPGAVRHGYPRRKDRHGRH